MRKTLIVVVFAFVILISSGCGKSVTNDLKNNENTLSDNPIVNTGESVTETVSEKEKVIRFDPEASSQDISTSNCINDASAKTQQIPTNASSTSSSYIATSSKHSIKTTTTQASTGANKVQQTPTNAPTTSSSYIPTSSEQSIETTITKAPTETYTKESKASRETEQNAEMERPISYYFPDIEKRENIQKIYLYRAYDAMTQYSQFKEAHINRFEETMLEDGKVKVRFHSDKGDYEVIINGSGVCISDNMN